MALFCKQAGCPGPQGDNCIENLSFAECPHTYEAETEDTQEADLSSEGDTKVEIQFVTTNSGSSLDAVTCDALLRQRPAKLIAFVGGPNVGKTTLLASVYERSRRNQLKEYGFAGSETILGFEDRCFLAREKCGLTVPNTQHTASKAELCFTHLRLSTPVGIQEWLLSDRSGEHFNRVRDYPDDLAGFSEIARADVLLFLIDGERLLADHHSAISEARALLQCLDQHKFLRNRKAIIVVTKSDKIVETEARKKVGDRVDRLVKSIKKTETEDALSVCFVASRTPKGEEDYGQGYQELLALIDEPVKRRSFKLHKIPDSNGRYPDALRSIGSSTQ